MVPDVLRNPKRVVEDGVRFLGAGAVNTLLTLALYQLLVFVMSPGVAYALCWAVGFAFVMWVYPRWVFKVEAKKSVKARSRQSLSVACVYAVSFVLGWCVVVGLNWLWGWERVSIFISVGITTLFNFAVMRWVLVRRVK